MKTAARGFPAHSPSVRADRAPYNATSSCCKRSCLSGKSVAAGEPHTTIRDTRNHFTLPVAQIPCSAHKCGLRRARLLLRAIGLTPGFRVLRPVCCRGFLERHSLLSASLMGSANRFLLLPCANVVRQINCAALAKCLSAAETRVKYVCVEALCRITLRF